MLLEQPFLIAMSHSRQLVQALARPPRSVIDQAVCVTTSLRHLREEQRIRQDARARSLPRLSIAAAALLATSIFVGSPIALSSTTPGLQERGDAGGDGAAIVFVGARRDFADSEIAVGLGAAPATASVEAPPELPENGPIVFAHVGDPLEGSDIRSIGTNGEGSMTLTEGTGSSAAPQVSPDGTKIAYFHQSDVAVMNIDGSDQHRLTDLGSTQYRTQLRWSPDGSTLAYLSLDEQTGYELFTIPAIGGEPQRISVGLTKVENQPYAWSPNSMRLAFGAYDASTGEDNVYVAAADGSSLEPITSHEGDGLCGNCWSPIAVDWSPKGSTIAYTRADDIWTIRPDGSEDAMLLPGSPSLSLPQWSPTAERLLYVASGLEVPGPLRVVDADGQNDRLIAREVWSADWSPDGTAIVFQGYQDTRRRAEIYTARASGGAPTRLTDNNSSDTDPVWAPGCTITGTPHADVIGGTPERDFICGGGGDDVIFGQGADDVLLGGRGEDSVYGGDGNDVVAGERGMDRLSGGAGDDTLNGRDGLIGERLSAGRGDDRCRRDADDVLVACEAIDRGL